ncbi:MAG: hypothetical protein M1820_003542 [Bogoriella megaspora]|nr:MAG: hypothetical protein M1820_003542 [Bogoriella megaspora]
MDGILNSLNWTATPRSLSDGEEDSSSAFSSPSDNVVVGADMDTIMSDASSQLATDSAPGSNTASSAFPFTRRTAARRPRKRRNSTPEQSARSASHSLNSMSLTLEDILPRQQSRSTLQSLEDDDDADSQNGRAGITQVLVRPTNRDGFGLSWTPRILRRRQIRQRNDPNSPTGRSVDRWQDLAVSRSDINSQNTSKNWLPAALLLYDNHNQHLTDNQDTVQRSDINTSQTSYLPLYLQSYEQTNVPKPSALRTVLPLDMDPGMLQFNQQPLRRSSRHQTSRIYWPTERMPVELFEQITEYLSRDDIKNMRLVNKEFEYGVSSVLFKTAVVPFNTEIYDMIEAKAPVEPDRKGKGKAVGLAGVVQNEDQPWALHWENRQEDKDNKVYKGHGLRVFTGFGPRILKYGMSFEVEEDALSRPPTKNLLEPQTSFWGGYEWPHEQYRRFADRAGLEQAADETSKMKQAFSHLRKVQQLALSVDSGLGWLRGPDISIRSHVFKRSPPVFGGSGRTLDRAYQQQGNLWEALQTSNEASDMNAWSLKTSTLYKKDISKRLSDLGKGDFAGYTDPTMWPRVDSRIMTESGVEMMYHSNEGSSTPSGLGVLYAQPEIESDGDDPLQLKRIPTINPKELTKEQKEWLLETEWAQRAFMMSYMLAIVDNPTIFYQVHTLNLARISSRYVPVLNRPDFWSALPNLATVVLKVIPDWRDCRKDNAGFVETPQKDPSFALQSFSELIQDQVKMVRTVETLTLGWVNGGEFGDGIYARNQHLLPAPILSFHDSISASGDTIDCLPFVKHLTLSNCWITPPAILSFVETSRNYGLQKLTFDSVSLTTHPRFQTAAHGLNNPAGNGAQQNHAQLIGQLQAAGGLNPAQNPHAAAAMLQLQQLQNQVVQGHVAPPGLMPFLQNAQIQAAGANVGLNPAAPAWFPPAVANAQFQNGQIPLQLQPQAFQWAFGNPPHVPPGQALPHLPVPPIPVQNPPANPQPQNPNTITSNQREGSWPYIIDQISPGRHLEDLNPDPDHSSSSSSSSPLPAETTTGTPLHPYPTLEFLSCGYARLNTTAFEQAALDPPPLNQHHHNLLSDPNFTNSGLGRDPTWFAKRTQALMPFMMATKDRMVGSVVSWMPEAELVVLELCWGLRRGWKGTRYEGREEEPEFDGCVRGGTGRFSGVVEGEG